MVKVAVIGAGFMGETHANALKGIEYADVVAIVDRLEDKGRKIAEEFNANYYSNLDDLLNNEDLDCVHVCVPTFLHADIVKKVANAGKHILCEKPIALSLKEADEMIEAVKVNKVKSMVGHVLRFWPEYVKAKELVDSGKLGKPIYAFCERLAVPPDWFEGNWGLNEEKSGGVPIDFVIHDLDYLNWIFGKPSIVKAQGVYNPGLGGMVHIASTVKFLNGGTGVVEGGWGFIGDFPFTMVLRILCEKGVVDWIFRAGKNIEERAQQADIMVYEPDGKTYKLEVESTDAYFLECKYFIDCIHNNKPIKKATFYDGRAALELALASRESAKENKIIKLY